MRVLRWPLLLAVALAKLLLLGYFCLRAYRIRLHAVTTFGMVIHEFDPWFNYRATEYLAEHGYKKFFKWYDYMSWYPIGRPIGTTIYPGMQFAAVWIWEAMKMLPETKIKMPKHILNQIPKWLQLYFPNRGRMLSFSPMSLNDVCCMVPAWFGSLATFFVYLLTTEISGSSSAGVASAFVMSMIPAHIMRSVAGGFDNEAVAVTTFCAVLYFWCRSIRNPGSWPWAVLTGIAYAAAAATWGGYIFINNLIGLHAAALVGFGKYNTGAYRAFTIYFIIGTLGAMQVPVISFTPLKSLEQMPSLLVFVGYQVLELCDAYRRRRAQAMGGWKFFFFRVMAFSLMGLVAVVAGYIGMQMGFFSPLGARIRGLFLEAVKTGNPLVDSVAEHSPANEKAYEMYLGEPRYLAVLGLFFCFHQPNLGKFLVFLYAAVAYHYSLKMSRLLIICGPIVSVLAGCPVGIVADWCVEQVISLICRPKAAPEEKPLPKRSGGMGSIYRTLWGCFGKAIYPQEVEDMLKVKDQFYANAPLLDKPIRAVIAVAIAVAAFKLGKAPTEKFISHCEDIAVHMSSPQLMFESKLNDGKKVMVDDYIRGYEWIKKNTPEDARVMAWWDYGYQITGIANRTSIADGNTWNHEHIATLGRILTSTEKKSHKAQRHLTDYVLVWAGGHGDDMGKSPHLARIGNSVFPDHCGDADPLCQKFSFYQDGAPTPMMAESFLYKAVNHNVKPGVKLNPKLFKEVHTTKYGLMRVFKVMNVSQESKDWVDNPENRICDAPGSWYCVGQYPPPIAPLIAKRRNFAQLEDFNKKSTGKSAYTKMIEDERAKKR